MKRIQVTQKSFIYNEIPLFYIENKENILLVESQEYKTPDPERDLNNRGPYRNGSTPKNPYFIRKFL